MPVSEGAQTIAGRARTVRESDSRVLPEIVSQHFEEAAGLWMIRDGSIRDSSLTLGEIERLDSRIDAHLDGMRVAADDGWAPDEEQLESGWGAEFFSAGVPAIESGDPARFDGLVAAAHRSAAAVADLPYIRARDPWRGLVSAIAWSERAVARPLIQRLLDTPRPRLRWLGVAAVGARRLVDAQGLETALIDDAPLVRGRAARVAGMLGRGDLRAPLHDLLADPDDVCRFWSTWAAVRLGSDKGVQALTRIAFDPGPFADAALTLMLRCLPPDRANAALRPLGKDPARRRSAVLGAAAIGDPLYLPWLVGQASDPDVARLAADAFSTITGVDLVAEHLQRDGDDAATGDGADDDGEDAALPWPNPARMGQWFKANESRFAPGTAYFLGIPKATADWISCIATGPQRHRAIAALELAIRHPSHAMFPVDARAAQQRRLLARARH